MHHACGKVQTMEEKPVKKSKKGIRLVAALLIIIAILLILLLVWRHWIGRTNYISDEDVEVMTELLETEAVLHASDVYHLEDVVPASAQQIKNTWTLLVIAEKADPESETPESGTDSTEAGEKIGYGQAAGIVLMTINHPMHEVHFNSFHTDLYAMFEGYGEHRLGQAYTAGGGPLLSSVIEKNYGVSIDQYASIRLDKVAEVLGMEDFTDLDINSQGVDVIENLVYGMQDVAPPMLLGYISKLLPYVTHNIPDAKVMNLIMQVPKVVQYYSVKDILPYEGLYQELDGYLVPDIERTSKRLQETIYAKPAAVAETETET